jgi:hypothetical protein
MHGDRTSDTVAQAMIEAMKELPEHLRRSLTWDRGTELAKYKDIQLALDLPVYFCEPPTPRGSAAQTRTPTACCGTGSPKAPTSAFTPKPTCAGSRTCSTADPDPP